MKKQKKLLVKIATLSIIMMMGYGIKVFAMERTVLSIKPETTDIVSVELPTISEEQGAVFDFILDPQGLINATNAVKYGGRIFEDGATLYFENKDGEFDFSRFSDKLTITNKSTMPVRVTITASIQNLGDVQIAPNDDFIGREDAALFLALIDDENNIYPIDEEGNVSITREMAAAPNNAYIYEYNEDVQTYEYELTENAQNIEFDTCSFGLTGACNAYGDWTNVIVEPILIVTWEVEPIVMESQENESELIEEILEQSDSSTTISAGDAIGIAEEYIDDREEIHSSNDEFVEEDVSGNDKVNTR